ncbi:hypothetical protein [Thomasclavelia cocleata]|uniref:hypothetical protein n=1 Tax=Thomasclavelia cocleata TaxID=69824 RepID=UPI00272DE9E6|nr:hypothetical protein [Thomasclavelia cocleata]
MKDVLSYEKLNFELCLFDLTRESLIDLLLVFYIRSVKTNMLTENKILVICDEVYYNFLFETIETLLDSLKLNELNNYKTKSGIVMKYRNQNKFRKKDLKNIKSFISKIENSFQNENYSTLILLNQNFNIVKNLIIKVCQNSESDFFYQKLIYLNNFNSLNRKIYDYFE